MTDSKKLSDEITDSGMTITAIAKKIGITREGFYKKLNNETEFKASEISALQKIITAGVEKVNDDSFIMPEKNVTLRATWKKLSITKSMDGKIAKVQTLYRLMADSSIGLDTDIDFSKSPTDNNSGVYTIASTENDKYPVHYYRGNIDNNNVLFAGFCWKMVRTTSTGGVKLIHI